MPAGGSVRTVYYENTDDDKTVVKFSAGGRTVTSHSQTDSFGRKVFDELQLGTDFVSRQFVYHAGKVTEEHKTNAKVKSSATTQLVSQIILSDGRTLSYEYDAEERITKVTDSIDGTTEYTYDALGQLLTETVNGEVVNSMEYDNYGNIIEKNGKAYTYGDATWKDLLTGFDGKTIEYDAQGNPVKYLGHTLTWEKGRQLKSFDNNVYTYNANGIRTSKKVNNVLHTYTLDGTKILRETWNDNTLVPLYDNEDSVCGILYNNVPYYFIKNLQGDVIAIVDKDAQTVARYSYDAWGVPTVTLDTSDCQIADINPFRYRGYYYDKEIGLYYLQSRYYNAGVGRFVNADDITCISQSRSALGFNIFAYCENNSIVFIDISGNLMKFSMKYAKSTIFSIKEFYNESKRVKKNFEKKYSIFNVDLVQINNFSSFEKKWNAMSAQDVVVINCHASPTSMNKGGMGITKLSQITNLNFKTIKCLILLGCNAGHYDYIWNNVAYEFSKKISGCVMASDGTVVSRLGCKFKSIADNMWKEHRDKKGSSRKKNWGWVIYRNYTWYSTNLDTISIPSAVDYLKKCNMVSFPNPLYEYYIPSFPVPNYYYL